MKKYSNKLILMILSIVMLFSLAIGVGCDCDGGQSSTGGGWTPIKKTATVSLNKSSEKLIVGDYLTVVATTNKVLNEEVVFESENPNVATVTDRGQIEAINAGTTNIVAKYGDVSAKCAITVVWDESYPVLIDVDGLEPSYVVYKDSSFEFRPAIKYRERIYYDAEVSFVSTNKDIVAFDGNVLSTNASAPIGSVVNCYVEASWRGFDSNSSPLLRSDFTVEIKKEAFISLKDSYEDFIKLYTRNEFEGKTYVSEKDIIPEFYVEGEKVEVEFDAEIENEELAYYEDNKVKAKKYGKTDIVISCEFEGQKYAKKLTVEIERPIADYQKEIGKFSIDIGMFKDINDNFARKTIVEEIYGTNDVTIIEAYQDVKRLTVEDNKIFGVTGLRDDVDHTIITIGTETEIYNVPLEVYGLYITEMVDFDFFTYTTSANNYYYLARDIDAKGFAFDYSGSCTCKTGLLGVFEGNGHVISNLDCKTCGLFGIVNGGTVQNVAFTNVNLTGYYGSLIGHRETGKAVLKNIYVQINSVNIRGGGLYQQTMSATGTHENIVVEYGISKEEVKEIMSKSGNSANISTFAPNRATFYKDGFKNCFSISYAPVGCSEPHGTDFSWASHVVAENQVIQGDLDANGKTPLTGVTDWDKELLDATTPDNFLKTKSATTAASNNEGTDVLKGVKAYQTYADMVSDKANNTEWLSTFNRDIWTVVNGVPYWKSLYEESVELIVKDGEEVVTEYVLGNLDSKLSITLRDKGSVIAGATIVASSDEIVVEGNVIKLKNKPLSTASYEVTISAIVEGMTIERTITISVIPTGIVVNAPVYYSADDKALDFDAINEELGLEGKNALSQDDIISYTIGSDTEVKTGELIVPVILLKGIYGNDKIVEPQTVRFLIGEENYEIKNVYAYTKVIDEAEDFNYFVLTPEKSAVGIEGYFVLANDIDMTGFVQETHAFVTGAIYPGTSDIGFHGVFDGQGHVISNLDAQSNGIFGNATAPVVKNVAFTNLSIGGNYPTVFVHSIKRDGWIDGTGYTKEALFENIYIELTKVNKTSGRANVLVNNSFYVGSKVRNVVVETNLNEETIELVKTNALQLGTIGGNASVMNNTLMFVDTYSISQAPLYSVGSTPYFGENQVEITQRNKNGIYIDAIGKVLDDNVNVILTAKGLTLDKKYFAPRVKAYANRDAMKLDATVNADSLATFNSAYWTIVDGIPVWNTAN